MQDKQTDQVRMQCPENKGFPQLVFRNTLFSEVTIVRLALPAKHIIGVEHIIGVGVT